MLPESTNRRRHLEILSAIIADMHVTVCMRGNMHLCMCVHVCI